MLRFEWSEAAVAKRREEGEGSTVMKCEEIREMMPDLASALMEVTPEIGGHLAGCGACAGKLEEFRQTMALLDQWQAPEPSPYFDVRLKARLREEIAKPQAGWLAWFRRPVLAAALTVLIAVGMGLFFTKSGGVYNSGDGCAVGSDRGAVFLSLPGAAQQLPGGAGTAVSTESPRGSACR